MSAPFLPKSGRLLPVLAACALLSACSSFDRKWRTAESPATCWDGRWISEKHAAPGGGPAGGRLRCLLTEAATNCFPKRPGIKPAKALQADFRANWLAFASSYTMTLTPLPGSRTDYRGTHELPAMFGGTYRYTARIAGDHFTARYDSSYDRGTFDLRRVRP